MFKAVLIIFLLSSLHAFAGVKEKKQISENKANITKKIEDLKKKCGFSTAPAVDVKWVSWDGHDYSKIHVKKVDVLKNVGQLVVNTLDDIVKLCADADYKSEVVKLKNISIDAKKELNSRYIDFSLEGAELSLKLNLDGVGSWKNAKRLKETWE